MAESNGSGLLSPPKLPNFTVRSAEAADPSFGSVNPSSATSSEQNPAMQGRSSHLDSQYGRLTTDSPPSNRDCLAWEVSGGTSRAKESDQGLEAGKGQPRRSSGMVFRRMSLEVPRNLDFLDKKTKGDQFFNGSDKLEKLGTLSGVFVPTTLNVLSILMFLRFGFILGQSGVLGMMGKRLAILHG